MPQLYLKELTGQWTYIKDVSGIQEAETWARGRFADYNDGALKRVITGVVVQDNMIYLYYDIRLTKNGNTFPVKVVMKVMPHE